jgi:hypothetical protein
LPENPASGSAMSCFRLFNPISEPTPKKKRIATMPKEDDEKGRRKEPRIWLYPEHWLWGSTRSEMTVEERSIFIDLLCLGITGLGKVDITHPEQLANQLCIPLDLLEKTLQKAIQYKKVRILCNKFEKKGGKKYAVFVNWKRYQPEYLHDRPRKRTDRKRSANSPKSDAHVVDRLDRIGLDRIEKDGREEDRPSSTSESSPTISHPIPSEQKKLTEGKTQKEAFFDLLRRCNGYPFSKLEDGILFDSTVLNFPNINVLAQTQKKILWWTQNPDALRPAANPREKLKRFFEEEAAFKKQGGPLPIGDVMVKDKDHARFLEQLISPPKKSINKDDDPEREGYG